MQKDIDQRIKQAQRKGVGIYLLTGAITLIVLIGFSLWLFAIKGFNLVIGPSAAMATAKVELVSGLAWVGDSKIYTVGTEAEIRVSAKTFETENYRIDNKSPSTINIELLPSPALLNASLQAEDPQLEDQVKQLANLSQWFLNGKLIHIGDHLSHKTVPGNYELSVTNPYFKGQTLSLALERAAQIEQTLSLSAVEGSISINSQPLGAQVLVNNEIRGITPIKVNVIGGLYKVELISQDYKTVSEEIPVQVAYRDPERNYLLAPKEGVLVIDATPKDGLLLINNIERELGEISLAVNKTHTIEYIKSGFSRFKKNVELNHQKPTVIDINLEAEFGTLIVNTNVAANISINGKSVGVTKPKQAFESILPALNYSVEASAVGYRKETRKVSIKNKQRLPLNINLLTEFEAKRQEGKPLFAESIGIQLLKFKGDAFTLGSASNETGRRRNEHQVEVDFSRDFWVSKHEITQAQFAAFSPTLQSTSKLPVTGVSWLQAAAFCNWLSQQEGLPAFYKFANGRYIGADPNAQGYRLPTEAEWEWLAKKAKRATSTVYVWGNQETLRDKQGNFADQSRKGQQLILLEDYQDGYAGLAPVGSFKEDRVGLYDLDGNVSEWVHDFYSNTLPNTQKTHVDYLGQNRGESWVVKGGNFESGRIRDLRAAYREFSSSGGSNIGFRIARYD